MVQCLRVKVLGAQKDSSELQSEFGSHRRGMLGVLGGKCISSARKGGRASQEEISFLWFDTSGLSLGLDHNLASFDDILDHMVVARHLVDQVLPPAQQVITKLLPL